MHESAPEFARPRTMHRFTARRVTVTGVAPIEQFIRITLSSDELDDWASTGPGDHAKIFFPDPETGELIAPTAAGPGESGIVRPGRPAFGRDFTPLNIRRDAASGHQVFDIDVLRHPDPGPAAAWAERAEPGDELVVVGPRGSVAAATGASRVVLIVDPTALPAAARWIEDMPDSAEIEVIADVAGDIDWVRSYLLAQGRREVPVAQAGSAPDGLVDAAYEAAIDAETYVFAAGEAGRLLPLRRFLRGVLALPREQWAVSGYWKQGDSAFDHHAPIDPEDPED